MAAATSHTRAPTRGRHHRAWLVAGITLAGLVLGAVLTGVAFAPGSAGSPTARHESAPATVTVANRGKLGAILVGAKGRTLYHFTKDRPGTLACRGGCLGVWPPLLLAKGAHLRAGHGVDHLGVVTRSGGKHQVTYEGEPLYYYAGDTKPGQVHGQGIEGLWFVVHPAAKTTSHTGSGW